MPADFDKCRTEGGKMRTISGPNLKYKLRAGEYMHICVDKDGHTVHLGEKKKVEQSSR